MRKAPAPDMEIFYFASRWRRLALVLLIASCAVPTQAALDLRNATVEKLDNGLTVILLEDRHFPVVSVQMLYRVGARNEVTGKTGLAHFLEHMAFRAAKHFPDTDLVSRIYAAGGEWHGYTWTDQTTYYATVPKNELDLLLRIEADRMHNLVLAQDKMDAERGAVLSEMHQYENSPVSMLIDAVTFTSFLAHPYRNNTIGWESDIKNLQHRDVLEFYQQHYHPGNAVLAIVGDFEQNVVRKRIKNLFAKLPQKMATPLPHTIEPEQQGVRRISVHGPAAHRQFMLAYRAPSVNSADYATFLVLQEILGNGSGVNFRQNDWGTPVDGNAPLANAAWQLTTWYPPSAQDYVFVIGGMAPDGRSEDEVEENIEQRIAPLRQEPPSDAMLADAINAVLDALVFDVETTEDAAHQLAFFDGLHALDTLLNLPQLVIKVTAEDVQRAASTYLLPNKRTIAWYLPAAPNGKPVLSTGSSAKPGKAPPLLPPNNTAIPAPVTATLSGGTPVILQRSDLSAAVHVQLVMPSNQLTGLSTNDPVSGYSSLFYTLRPAQLAPTILQAREAISALNIASVNGEPQSGDPATRLEQEFASIMFRGMSRTKVSRVPALLVVTGDIDTNDTLTLLEQSFGALSVEPSLKKPATAVSPEDKVVTLDKPVAQAQLGYIVAAPGPGKHASDAYRLLLYILSHDYEGRLGKKAISEQGLAYYIGSQYRSDSTDAWITLSTGVDPHNIAPLKALLGAELNRLQHEPPTVAEINAAKQHMLGRLQSAAQSNAELATQLATHWLWYGETVTPESLQRRLDAIKRQDILEYIPAFIQGATLVIAH